MGSERRRRMGFLPNRPLSPTAREHDLLHTTVGEPYDRDPCPAVLRSRALVDPAKLRREQAGGPTDPEPSTLVRGKTNALPAVLGDLIFGRAGREKVQTTDAPCVRPRNHTSSGDPAEQPHATADGRTWS